MVDVNDMRCTMKGSHDMCPCTCKEVCNAQSVESSTSRCSAHLFVFSGLIIMLDVNFKLETPFVSLDC